MRSKTRRTRSTFERNFPATSRAALECGSNEVPYYAPVLRKSDPLRAPGLA